MHHAHSWDERYAASPHLFSHEPDTAMVELVAPLSPGRAADLGAGEGRNSLWLARHGWQVTAVDASQVALGRLRSAAEGDGLPITPAVADIHEFLGRGERFELVLMANVHPAAEERGALLAGAARAVSPGGHLLVVGHHRDSLGRVGPLDLGRLYTEETLSSEIPGLDILLLERRERTHGGDTGEPVVDLILWAQAPPATLSRHGAEHPGT